MPQPRHQPLIPDDADIVTTPRKFEAVTLAPLISARCRADFLLTITYTQGRLLAAPESLAGHGRSEQAPLRNCKKYQPRRLSSSNNIERLSNTRSSSSSLLKPSFFSSLKRRPIKEGSLTSLTTTLPALFVTM